MDHVNHRSQACKFLIDIDENIPKGNLSDSIFPFVRQFANIDINWFNEFGWQKLQNWLKAFVESNMFDESQKKFVKWRPAADPVFFP